MHYRSDGTTCVCWSLFLAVDGHGVQPSFDPHSSLSHLVQLCEELRCAHGMELARVRNSFESESFELQEELAAVREQLRASERKRREMERRCSKKEEAMLGLEARVSLLEEELELEQVPVASVSILN